MGEARWKVGYDYKNILWTTCVWKASNASRYKKARFTSKTGLQYKNGNNNKHGRAF